MDQEKKEKLIKSWFNKNIIISAYQNRDFVNFYLKKTFLNKQGGPGSWCLSLNEKELLILNIMIQEVLKQHFIEREFVPDKDIRKERPQETKKIN